MGFFVKCCQHGLCFTLCALRHENVSMNMDKIKNRDLSRFFLTSNRLWVVFRFVYFFACNLFNSFNSFETSFNFR